MRKFILLLFSLMLLLSMVACSKNSEDTTTNAPTASASSWTYDMKKYGDFRQIFEEESDIQWQNMGQYTICLQGLCTPITVKMDGLTVRSVSAYNYTLDVNIDEYQNYMNADIDEYEGAILINEWQDYKGSTWIITKTKCYEYHPVGDISTQVFVDYHGALRYERYLGDYKTSFDQWETAPIDICSGRDDFVYETGYAAIVDEAVILTAEESFSVSELYDLDAMFANAKALGMYEGYDTVDERMAANKNQSQ